MKTIINEREYELKELTKEEARAYISKEVYVWDSNEDAPVKRKLLEVFMPDCGFPFCVLRLDGKTVCNYMYCAPVPEEWYVHRLPDGRYESICPSAPKYHTVDHGSKEYYKQKAIELKAQIEKQKAHCKAVDEMNEKMKCGGNCKHSYSVNTGGCYDTKCELTGCDCINCKDKWELKE